MGATRTKPVRPGSQSFSIPPCSELIGRLLHLQMPSVLDYDHRVHFFNARVRSLSIADPLPLPIPRSRDHPHHDRQPALLDTLPCTEPPSRFFSGALASTTRSLDRDQERNRQAQIAFCVIAPLPHTSPDRTSRATAVRPLEIAPPPLRSHLGLGHLIVLDGSLVRQDENPRVHHHLRWDSTEGGGSPL